MENTQRTILLNALPLNALPRQQLHLYIRPISMEEIRNYVQGQIVNYIRHQSTVNVLNEILGLNGLQPNSGIYQWRQNDRLIIVTLRNAVRGGEVSVTLDDLEAWVVEVE